MKKLLQLALLAACINANAAVIDFNHSSGQAGNAIGSDYSGQGVVFTNAYYSNAYGLNWASGEADTEYNGVVDQPMTGYFVGGTTNYLAGTAMYPDGDTITTLRVFDIFNNLLGQVSTASGGSSLDIAVNGIASFEFSWSGGAADHDDVIGLDDITYNALTPNQNVPEPGILALIALGLAGLGFMRRKQ